jgi:hypothetical protein
MVKDVFPLPYIDTIIKGMRGMVLFSKFDLCNSYWNIRNSEETEDLMAFKNDQRTLCSQSNELWTN